MPVKTCYWGRFTSIYCFEIQWIQLHRKAYKPSGNYITDDALQSFSNALNESKMGLMGPKDSLVVRHYKIIFIR